MSLQIQSMNNENSSASSNMSFEYLESSTNSSDVENTYFSLHNDTHSSDDSSNHSSLLSSSSHKNNSAHFLESHCSLDPSSYSTSSNSTSPSFTSRSFTDFDSQISDSNSSNTPIQSISSGKQKQLKNGRKAKPTINTSHTTPEFTIDSIGSFNINKHYSHECSAELMLRSNLSLLAIQEPFGTFTTNDDAWKSYRIANLNEANFKAYESKHQVLIVDEDKWGGKNLEELQCYQEGRIMAMPFFLTNNQYIGIISIYAITSGFGTLANGKNKTDIRSKTSETARKIFNQWEKKYPDIVIIIMGDLQDTWSTSNLDNLGKFRKDKDENGVLHEFSNTHVSLVRKDRENDNLHYWTREGRLGARGIDHILIPSALQDSPWQFEGKMEKKLGELFYHSDHSLITASFFRFDQNENIIEQNKTSYNYRDIFSIPLKSSGKWNQNNEFDDSKFKSDLLLQQGNLYNKIQSLTEPNSPFSKLHKNTIDKKISILFNQFWQRGITTNKMGKGNKLVKTNEDDAKLLEEISILFKTAIEDMMENLKLTSENTSKGKIQSKRNNLKKIGCTKPFNTLPATSKLRLALKCVKRYSTKLKVMLDEIKLEQNIRICLNNPQDYKKPISDNKTHTDSSTTKPPLQTTPIIPRKRKRRKQRMKNPNIEHKIIILLNSKHISETINNISKDLANDYALWKQHTEAIKHMRPTNDLATDKTYGYTINNKGGDTLANLDNEDVTFLNNLLREGGSKHPFKHPNSEEDLPDQSKITSKLDDWKNHLRACTDWAGNLHSATDEQLIKMPIHLKQAIKSLARLQRQVSWKQRTFKHSKINYHCETNNMSAMTNSLKPKSRCAPAVHNLIYDEDLQSFRQCRSIKEQLKATKDYHDKWMSPSPSKQTCFFAELRREGTLGIRGVNLFPDRKITKDDIKNIIHPNNKLNEEIINRILKAHGPHTAEEFRAPEKHNPLFDYPFFFTNNKGDLNNTFIEEDFWNAINKIPTKARFDNYHIAIAGRMHKSWASTLLNIAKLILVLRLVPQNINILSRIPIPKPGKQNEYRPLSVCEDLFCFVNGVFAKHAAAATEKAEVLHDAVMAYRKGKGCQSLVTVELAIREDCIESGKLCALLLEDIEKFFDRLTAEIILNAMRKAGFPEEGYLEFKASSLSFKKVIIQTIKGSIATIFECGLEQGNPDSPRAANLVIMNIHNMWKKSSKKNTNYSFATTDEDDGTVEAGEAGFSDDNLVFLWDNNTSELILIIQKKIDMTGDFSIVCKLGRKGSKCAILLFNIPAEEIKKIIRFFSVAWSFQHDRPTKEEIKIIMYVQKEEACKLDPSIKSSAEISYDTEGNIIIKEMTDFSEIKHLGLTMSTEGDTTTSAKDIIKNIKTKINSLNIRNLKDNPQRHSCNMLLNTLHSYAPLPNNINILDLRQCDKLLSQVLRKKKGLAKNDTNIHLFVSEEKCGFGIKSFVDTYLTAIAREAEVILNSSGLDARSSRARLASHMKYYDNSNFPRGPNHITDAISKLCEQGLFLRDQKDGIINYLIEEIRLWKGKVPIGMPGFSKQKDTHIGEKHKDLLEFINGGNTYRLIKDYTSYKKSNFPNEIRKIYKKQKERKIIKHLDTIWHRVVGQKIQDFTSLFNLYEWIRNSNDPTPNSKSPWNHLDCHSEELLQKDHWTPSEIWNICQGAICIEPSNHTNWINGRLTPYDNYGEILEKIIMSKSPLIISTDGGLKLNNGSVLATASITWSILQIKPNESITSGEWTSRTTIPLLQRNCLLPKQIGASTTDIGHAELLAFCMQEECLPPHLPRIVVMDSNAVRQRVLELRSPNSESQRYNIRKIYGGLGKYLISRAKLSINKWKNLNEEHYNQPAWTPSDFDTGLNNTIYKTLYKRNKEFTNLINSWQDEEPPTWKESYKDTNNIRTIIKVDSHQLNESGTSINSLKPRYKRLVPNLALLSANFWADDGANHMMKRHLADTHNYPMPGINHFPINDHRFNITYNGKIIDKQLSSFLLNVFENERLIRLQKREFQGLLARMSPHTLTTPRDLARTSGHRRYLSNLTSTHTRACYKCNQYLALNIMDLDNTPLDKANDRFYEILLTKNALNKHKHVLFCQICKTQTKTGENTTSPRGNRRHFTHFCPHPKILQFRDGINNKIEFLLKELLQLIDGYIGTNSSRSLLFKINKILLQKELQDTGKLSIILNDDNSTPLPTSKQCNYLSIKEWCSQLGAKNLNQALQENIPILQHILGFRTALPDGNFEEIDMGLVDCIGIGLIPTVLNKTILSHCKELATSILDRNVANCFLQKTNKLWRKIISYLKGRGIGIHRITKNLTSDREQFLRAKFNLPKKEVCKKQLEEKRATIREELESEYAIKPTPSPTQMKTCKGPTCLYQSSTVYTNKTKGTQLTPNLIKSSHRCCSRCINHETAMRRCNNTLHLISSCSPSAIASLDSILLQDENPNNILKPLANWLINETGESKPWLTKENCISYKGRGLKMNIRKPIQMLISILRGDNKPTIKVEHGLSNYHSPDAESKHTSTIFLIKQYFSPLTTPLKSYHTPTNPTKDKRTVFTKASHTNIQSPLIKDNLKNLGLSQSPKRNKNSKRKSQAPEDSPIKLCCKLEHPSTITNTSKSSSKINPEIDPSAPQTTSSKASTNNPSPQACTFKSSKHNIDQLRLPNNTTRSLIMNDMINALNTISDNKLHLANTNLIPFLIASGIKNLECIPNNINFQTKAARTRRPGIYLFPIFTGSFHHGHWSLICIAKPIKSTQEARGWILDPVELPSSHNPPSQVTKILESKLMFSRSISWQQQLHLPPLTESESGTRLITSCCIIALGTENNIPLDSLITEAANIKIATGNYLANFCRETAYLLLHNNKRIWKVDTLITQETLTNNIQPIRSLTSKENCLPPEDIKNHPNNLPVSTQPTKTTASTSLIDFFNAEVKEKLDSDNSLILPKRKRIRAKKRNIPKKKLKEKLKTSRRNKARADFLSKHKKNTSTTNNNTSSTLSFRNVNTNAPPTHLYNTEQESYKKITTPKRDSRFLQTKYTTTNDIPPNAPHPKHSSYQHTNHTKYEHLHQLSPPSPHKRVSPHIHLTQSQKGKKNPLNLSQTLSILNQQGEENEIVAQLDNDTISRRNLWTLRPRAWLSDEVIHFFIHLLVIHINETKTYRIFAFKSFFFNELSQGNSYNFDRLKRYSRWAPNRNIFQLRSLFIPVHLDNSHWSLIHVDFTNSSIEYLDSLGNSGSAHLNFTFKYLQDEYLQTYHCNMPNLSNWSILQNNNNTTPKQENNYDCGIFTCLFAEALANNIRPTFSQSDLFHCRLWITHAILQRCIPSCHWRYCVTTSL